MIQSQSVDSITYWSRAVRPMPDEELVALLEAAREKNEVRGITGMLLYKDQCFLQVVEGAAEDLERLYVRIVRDPRHVGVTILRRDFEPRRFSDWSMGFRNLHNWQAEPGEPGKSDLMSIPFDADYFGAHPSKAQEMLLCFQGLNDPKVLLKL